MAKRSKIRETKLPLETERIRPSETDGTQSVSFNFRRLKQNEGKFIYEQQEGNYFCTLLERLKNISLMTRMEMTHKNAKSLRCHHVDFTNVQVSENTFGILGEDVDQDAYQFSITSNEHGRVCGYFVEHIFFVVWLDPDHELYSGA